MIRSRVRQSSATSVVMREEVVAALLAALARPELTGDAADRLSRYGNGLVPRLAQCLHDEQVPVEIRRELPQVLVRIGTPVALEVLIQGLMQSDVTLRQRVIASLNKLHDIHPDVHLDGHTRRAGARRGNRRALSVVSGARPVARTPQRRRSGLEGCDRSIDQELERMFRLMTLLVPGPGVHDAYVGVRSGEPDGPRERARYLDNVLKPDLRRLLLPLIDSHVHNRGAHRYGQSDRRRPARDGRTGDRGRCWRAKIRGCDRAAPMRSARCDCTTSSPNCTSSRRPTNPRCARPFRLRCIASPANPRHHRRRLPSDGSGSDRWCQRRHGVATLVRA